MSDETEPAAVIDFVAPESSPGVVQCGARIAVPEAGAYPHCQLPEGHPAWHRYIVTLSGLEGEVEYRWS